MKRPEETKHSKTTTDELSYQCLSPNFDINVAYQLYMSVMQLGPVWKKQNKTVG